MPLLEKMLFTFLFSLILFGLFHFVRMTMKIIAQSLMPKAVQFRNQFISKPEAKDRERLFHAITSIIRDDKIAEQLQSPHVRQLSEEEEAALIEQITMEVNQGRL